MELAQKNAEMADLCLVLGSSLTVMPANSIPDIVGQTKGAKLAICNLQTTPIDNITDLRVFSEADVLMTKVMEKLNLPIPPFVLRRRLVIKVETQEEDRHRIIATGVDTDATPVSFLQSVRLEGSRCIARAEPFIILVRESLRPGYQLKLDLEFMGHYDEPNLEILHEYNGEEEVLYILEFNVENGKWTISKQEDLADTTESLTIGV
jgi:mono-ADP-ribosyltransferase sirtuin 6